MTVDRAIGGMEQGSRISPPESKTTAPLTDIHKTISSPQSSEKKAAIPAKSADEGNHGYIENTGNTGQTDNQTPTGTNGSEIGTNDSENKNIETGGTQT